MTRIQRSSALGVIASLFLLGSLSACSDEDGLEAGVVAGFAGVVAADEPHAAVVGRDVLAVGGNAADAAVAMYFALSVTYPSRTGLAGGGVCLTFDSAAARADVIEFLPRRAQAGGLLPIGVRAFAAIHARMGVLRWEQLVAPSENYARFGFPASRALVSDVAQARDLILADPELKALLSTSSGQLPAEGERIEQFELSTILAGIRQQGAGYVYSGPFPSRFADAAAAVGQVMTPEEIRAAVPEVLVPAMVEFDSEELYFSVPPADGGLLAAILWQLLTEVEDYEDAGEEERAHLLAEASILALSDRAGWDGVADGEGLTWDRHVDEDRLSELFASYQPASHRPVGALSRQPEVSLEAPFGTSFVVGDRKGGAVACSLTLNGLFGSGRIAPGTGLILAEPPGPGTPPGFGASVAVLASTFAGDAHAAAAASGGAYAPSALVQVLLSLLAERQPVKTAVTQPRVHHGGVPDVVHFEPGTSDGVLAGLITRQHRLVENREIGRVNAFECPEGLQDDEDDRCSVASDPRGSGLGLLAQ